MEHWKDIEGHPNHEVSDLGRVRNKKTGRIMKQFRGQNGYLQLQIDKRNERVHRMVATAFLGGNHQELDVNHKDTNKENNCVSNLEWTTRSENIIHSFKHGIRKSNLTDDLRKKGSQAMVKKMSQKVMVIETGVIYPSVNECARQTGCYPTQINHCCTGKAKEHHGLHFKFVD